MKYSKIKFGLVVMISSLVLFTACKRNPKTKDVDVDNTVASDNALGEFVYNDALNIADQASLTASGANLENYKMRSTCATVTHDTTSNPKTITVDFGPTNCLCGDNRYRRGKILIAYTGHYKDSGHVHTITFDQYYVNNNQVLGTKSVTNMGHNANNQMYFTVTVNGLIIKATTLDSIIWNHNRTRTFVQGENTQTKQDDVYEITGSGSGQRANGTSYTMNITQPLVKAINCDWIKAGEMQIQPNGGLLRTFNFGSGTCDNQATVTVNGNTYNITLN